MGGALQLIFVIGESDHISGYIKFNGRKCLYPYEMQMYQRIDGLT